MKTLFFAAFLLLLTAGCALPQTSIKTGSSRPSIQIKGAPADATLLIDGIEMGNASQFDGNPKILLVEEGVHSVEIRRSNQVLHAEKAAVSNGETRTVTVSAGDHQ